jgi:hypothetical protein
MSKENCGHLAIDAGGRCESCLEVIETGYAHYSAPPPPRETTPEELRAEADALAAAWEAICERVGKRRQ